MYASPLDLDGVINIDPCPSKRRLFKDKALDVSLPHPHHHEALSCQTTTRNPLGNSGSPRRTECHTYTEPDKKARYDGGRALNSPATKVCNSTLLGPSASLIRSSTCKYLANFCAPALFSTIRAARKAEEVVNLLDYLINIGCFVRHLKLRFHGMDNHILVEVVNRCSDLRCLTIYHYSRSKLDPVQLLAALKTLPRLAEIRFKELPSLRWDEGAAQTMFIPLLQAHGSKLRSLKISGYGTLGNGGLTSLTHDASRLVELELYKGLHVGLRHSFVESGTWACAGHLQSLTFTNCGGLHAGIFTQKLASGVFGHPQRVSLAMCGDRSDDRKPPEAIEWTIPALDTFKLDQFAMWEMEHLQLIHARKVFLSRVWTRGPRGMYKMVIQQIADKSVFPEVVEVHVTTDWGDEDFRELQCVCSVRGVKLVMRDWKN